VYRSMCPAEGSPLHTPWRQTTSVIGSSSDPPRSMRSWQILTRSRHTDKKLDHLVNWQWNPLGEIQLIQLEFIEDLAARI